MFWVSSNAPTALAKSTAIVVEPRCRIASMQGQAKTAKPADDCNNSSAGVGGTVSHGVSRFHRETVRRLRFPSVRSSNANKATKIHPDAMKAAARKRRSDVGDLAAVPIITTPHKPMPTTRNQSSRPSSGIGDHQMVTRDQAIRAARRARKTRGRAPKTAVRLPSISKNIRAGSTSSSTMPLGEKTATRG